MIIKTVASTKAIVVSSCIYKLSEREKLERLEKIMKNFKITFLFNKFRKTYGIIKFPTWLGDQWFWREKDRWDEGIENDKLA